VLPEEEQPEYPRKPKFTANEVKKRSEEKDKEAAIARKAADEKACVHFENMSETQVNQITNKFDANCTSLSDEERKLKKALLFTYPIFVSRDGKNRKFYCKVEYQCHKASEGGKYNRSTLKVKDVQEPKK
jgi:hypothetical protein